MRSFLLFLMLAAAPAAAGQTPVLMLLNQFERSVESNSSDYFYEAGSFYVSERIEPNTRDAPGRHRLVAFDAVTGEKTVVTEPRSGLVRNGWVRGDYV